MIRLLISHILELAQLIVPNKAEKLLRITRRNFIFIKMVIRNSKEVSSKIKQLKFHSQVRNYSICLTKINQAIMHPPN